MTIAKRIIPVLTACATAAGLVMLGPAATADTGRPGAVARTDAGRSAAQQPTVLDRRVACVYRVRNVRRSSYLNVRSGPGLRYRPIGRLTVATGRFHGACRASGDWIAVRTGNGQRGWAHAHYLRKLGVTPGRLIKLSDLTCAYQVRRLPKTSFLNVRKGPGLRYRPAGRLRVTDGRFIGACDAKRGWIAVKASNGKLGWAFGYYLRKLT